jgi:hypothetical protein
MTDLYDDSKKQSGNSQTVGLHKNGLIFKKSQVTIASRLPAFYPNGAKEQQLCPSDDLSPTRDSNPYFTPQRKPSSEEQKDANPTF